jgi:hypothetical protein
MERAELQRRRAYRTMHGDGWLAGQKLRDRTARRDAQEVLLPGWHAPHRNRLHRTARTAEVSWIPGWLACTRARMQHKSGQDTIYGFVRIIKLLSTLRSIRNRLLLTRCRNQLRVRPDLQPSVAILSPLCYFDPMTKIFR